MGDLILNSLEIEGFRAFDRLTIERLGQVNLIVGKNNVGKSCLLEALRIYARRGSPETIRDILTSRDESGGFDDQATEVDYIDAVKHLFYERKIFGEHPDGDTFKIGPAGEANLQLVVSAQWFEEIDDGRRKSWRPSEGAPPPIEGTNNFLPGISITFGEKPVISGPLSRFSLDGRFFRYPTLQRESGIACQFIPSDGLNEDTLAELWDNVTLKPEEEEVLEGMHIIEPGVERISLIGPRWGRGRTRIPVVKMRNVSEPIPLRSLGEGMTRLFGIVLALVNARDGLLLVDEVDSGLHYTVHPALWRLVFRVAAHLNVQVFATTHSWDCIQGFQQAAQELGNNDDGMLVRLERRQGHIVPILFDMSRLGIATRQEIEVR